MGGKVVWCVQWLEKHVFLAALNIFVQVVRVSVRVSARVCVTPILTLNYQKEQITLLKLIMNLT